ncbi:MAG: hypothetical protein ACRC33_29090 [Gemmataceae bacterium]
MAASAPAWDGDGAKLTVEKLRAALGTSHFSAEFTAVRAVIEAKPDAHYAKLPEKSFRLVWKAAGLCATFDAASKLKRLTLEPGYAGGLPAGLTFKDGPADVRRKLGPPGRATGEPAEWVYPAKGVAVRFTAAKPAGEGATVAAVFLMTAEKGD